MYYCHVPQNQIVLVTIERTTREPQRSGGLLPLLCAFTSFPDIFLCLRACARVSDIIHRVPAPVEVYVLLFWFQFESAHRDEQTLCPLPFHFLLQGKNIISDRNLQENHRQNKKKLQWSSAEYTQVKKSAKTPLRNLSKKMKMCSVKCWKPKSGREKNWCWQVGNARGHW